MTDPIRDLYELVQALSAQASALAKEVRKSAAVLEALVEEVDQLSPGAAKRVVGAMRLEMSGYDPSAANDE